MLAGDRAKLYETKAHSGVAIDDALGDAWARTRGGSGTEWVLGKADPEKRGHVILDATGAGGLSELLTACKDDQIQYGACAVYNGGGLRKLFFITWVGPSVSPIKKARVSLEKQGIYNAFEGVVADVFITDKEDLTEDRIMERLAKTVPGVKLTA